MNWWEAGLAYVIGPVLVAGGTWAATRASSKASTHAANRTADVQSDSVQIEGYHKLVTDMRSDLDRLRVDLDKVQRNHDKLEERVKHMQRQELRDKSLIRHLIGYCRRLRDEVVRLGGEVPEPPGGLDLDDPSTDPSLA